MRGTIPEKVTYLFNSSYMSDEKDNQIPAFVSDANSETSKVTGERWAIRQKYNYQTQQYTTEGEVVKFTLPNSPLKDLAIKDLSKRYNGGRAWKVIVPVEGHNLYMDLREDSLMDAILNSGILPGGILNGEWVWAVVGSERKLTRVGSDNWKAYSENSKRKTNKEIKKDFEIGGIYKTISNESWIYLGKINSYRKVVTWHPCLTDRYGQKTSTFEFQKLNNQDLWGKIDNDAKNLECIQHYWDLRLGKAPKLYEKADQWELSLPTYIEDLRTQISKDSDFDYMQDASLPNKSLRSLNLPLSVLNNFFSKGIDVDNA